MKIDGRSIADKIRKKLKRQVIDLQSKDIIPQLAVVLIGNNPSSIIYVRQKQKVGEEIGVKVSIFKKDFIDLINKLNNDKLVHGVIIQRPIPIDMGKEELDRLVLPEKDVDGFHPESPFTPPVASAVIKILEWVKKDKGISGIFMDWLKKQKILIIGRGETAGKPIIRTLTKLEIKFKGAHSQITNLRELCLEANIIISCVGKGNIVRHYMLKRNTVLIGVGLHPENEKLKPDYNQEEIANLIDYYTPVPGGVGPVNVACLFENLLLACRKLANQ